MNEKIIQYWWCSNCKEEVDGGRVTFEEMHDDCGHPVAWIEHSQEESNALIELRAVVEKLEAEKNAVISSSIRLLTGQHEPGEFIANTVCPCCGAKLEIEYGDDEGEIAIIGTRNASRRPGAAGKEAMNENLKARIDVVIDYLDEIEHPPMKATVLELWAEYEKLGTQYAVMSKILQHLADEVTKCVFSLLEKEVAQKILKELGR